MNTSKSGMVLLSTIFMISVMSLLLLSLMKAMLLYTRASHQIIEQHNMLHQMESVISRLDLSDKRCINESSHELDAFNRSIDQLTMHQGCLYQTPEHEYQYVIDDLGSYPCLQITTSSGINGSQHWLVTIANTTLPHAMLQVRIAQPIKTRPCDTNHDNNKDTNKVINAGIISWRYIHQ